MAATRHQSHRKSLRKSVSKGSSKSVPKGKKKSVAKKSKSHSRSRSSSSGPVAKFYCMGCRKSVTSSIDKYDKGKSGGTFAKGRCKNCDGKLSVTVRAEDVVRL